MSTVQVLEEMAPAWAVQTVLGDFPSGNSPEQADLSRPHLEEIGVESSLEVSSSQYYSGIIQRRHFMEQTEQLCPGLTIEGSKTQTNLTKKPIKTTAIKTPTTHPLLKYILYKDRAINRHLYPQNRIKCPFPLKGPSPSCCQTCKMRKKHRRVLYVTSEDEALNSPLTIPWSSSVLLLCFPLWFGLLFYFTFFNNFDHYHLI